MGDSYRPARAERERPPPLADRMTFGNGTGDSYRPGSQNHSEFTFESNHRAPQFPPTGPANPGRAPTRRDRGGGASRRGRGGQRNGRNNANGQRRGQYRKAAPHERALLQIRDDGSPEHTYGVSEGTNRFLDPDDLSDDEEADMDMDSNASGDDIANGQNGTHKVARTQVVRADGNSVTKWSNPDPYTALPPPSETTGVKKDVVQLIRKAKNLAAEKALANNAVAANDDFISFGDIGEDDDAEDDYNEPELRMLEDERARNKNVRDEPRYDPNPLAESGRGRKRKMGGDTGLKPEWVATARGDRTPWAESRETYAHLSKEPARWLHNEILDFYDFVAPQEFEHNARHNLVQRISSGLAHQKFFPLDRGRILCFGSFPAGLYLPTADMDLVYVSEGHYDGHPPIFDANSDRRDIKNILYKASRKLQNIGIALQPSVIPMAKVPIIKFKDRITNIDVDISFENLSGVQAQATFHEWKQNYPDMVYLVALVKQLLVMRGLNEVHTGGLGGFSIICMITNFLARSEKAENLGECFLAFLEYYGRKFDIRRERLVMHPPKIVRKTDIGIDGRPEKDDGLSIQDPNRPDNNISGGSRRAVEALKVFADAHDTLKHRMELSKLGQDIGPSILDSIIGGNYETYIKQRRHLRTLK
ncbi:Nucleotidyltransferase [Setomelanomma holmii]|uniref:polynucleotide adenylyltransferase n=1 Tax=Setomelanomma holmii TaxID=210430 RepID=A0A9P4LKU7_9PLEO|nr:Nucleotidyltransferase [Setomelanomma holmii]